MLEVDHIYSVRLDLGEMSGSCAVTQTTDLEVALIINTLQQRASSQTVPGEVDLRVDSIVEHKGERAGDTTDDIHDPLDDIRRVLLFRRVCIRPVHGFQQETKDQFSIIALNRFTFDLPGVTIEAEHGCGIRIYQRLRDHMVASHRQDGRGEAKKNSCGCSANCLIVADHIVFHSVDVVVVRSPAP